MQVKVGDTIRYNRNQFSEVKQPLICTCPVVEIVKIDTGYGDYEEYKTAAGDWVSELQLND